MQLKYAKMQHLPLPASLCAKVGRLSQRTSGVSTKPSTNKDVFDGGIYKVYYWIVPLLSFFIWVLRLRGYPISPHTYKRPSSTTDSAACLLYKAKVLFVTFSSQEKLECKSWGIYKPIYAVLNYIIILFVHLSQYVNNPFAHKSIFKAQFENFQKKFISPAIFKPFPETPSTL